MITVKHRWRGFQPVGSSAWQASGVLELAEPAGLAGGWLGRSDQGRPCR